MTITNSHTNANDSVNGHQWKLVFYGLINLGIYKIISNYFAYDICCAHTCKYIKTLKWMEMKANIHTQTSRTNDNNIIAVQSNHTGCSPKTSWIINKQTDNQISNKICTIQMATVLLKNTQIMSFYILVSKIHLSCALQFGIIIKWTIN